MLTEDKVLKKVIAAIHDAMIVDGVDIDMETHFQHDLGTDSVDIVTLLMTLEEQFGDNVAESDAMGFETVGDVVNYILQYKSSAVEISGAEV